MAIIDLASLQPSSISRDLRKKYLLIYSLPKVGKTSFAAKCPRNLILCFENGVNFLSGVYAVRIEKWTDLKVILKQLSREDVRQKFDTVTYDTLSIAWRLCEQYICNKHGVKALGDIPWGRGFSEVTEEFDECLRTLVNLEYGIILLTHAKIKTESVGEDKTVTYISPNVPERAQAIVNPLVDLIGYLKVDYEQVGDNEENWKAKRTLITRATPYITAGCRSKYISPEIPFTTDGYSELVKAFSDAIDKEENSGAIVVEKDADFSVLPHRDFSETLAEAKELWERIVGVGDNASPEQAEKIMNKVIKLFGEPMKLSEIPEEKQDIFELLILEMKEM